MDRGSGTNLRALGTSTEDGVRSRNYLIVAGVLLGIGLVPALGRHAPPQKQPNLVADRDRAPESPAPSAEAKASCPKGQLDDFGVCVPVAQTPPRAHSSPENQRPGP